LLQSKHTSSTLPGADGFSQYEQLADILAHSRPARKPNLILRTAN